MSFCVLDVLYKVGGLLHHAHGFKRAVRPGWCAMLATGISVHEPPGIHIHIYIYIY